MNSLKESPVRKFFLPSIIILIVIKLVYSLTANPNPDEAYYWTWGQHLQWSYHDHPGLQAWVQGLLSALLGKSLLVLRLPALISTGVIAFYLYKIGRRFFPGTPPILLIGTILSAPLFFLFTTFAWNDYLMLTLCLISGYHWLLFLSDRYKGEKGSNSDLLIGALCLGLAGISKYNALFLALAIAWVIICNKPLHRLFFDFRFYLAILMVVVLVSPVFIWNAQHGNSTFAYNLESRIVEPFRTLNFKRGNTAGLVFGSFITLSPFLWILIVKSLLTENKNLVDPLYRKFALALFSITTLFFLVISIFSNTLYYWTLPAYLFILPLAISQHKTNPLLKASVIFSLVLNCIMVVHLAIISFSVFSEKNRDHDAELQYGWKQIGQVVRQQQQHQKTPIFTTQYRTAAMLSYELDRNDIFSVNRQKDQFSYWREEFLFKCDTVLVLADDREPIGPEMEALLGTISPLDTLEIKRFGWPVKTYYLYRGELNKD